MEKKKTLTHWRLKMYSMMDAIKSCNHIKIQQLFENEHVVLKYSNDVILQWVRQILIPDAHANRLLTIKTTGDGNSLYNAVSLVIRGNKIICTPYLHETIMPGGGLILRVHAATGS